MLQLILFLSLIAASAASCNRTCGKTTVPYPFGFSPSCSIRLSCNSTSSISFSGFSLQNFTTNNTFLLNISADCTRSISSVSEFFSTNYALTHRNGFFDRNCTSSDTPPCLLPTMLVSQWSHQFGLSSCGAKEGNLTCFFNNTGNMYLTKEGVVNNSCGDLFTSILYDPYEAGKTVLMLGVVEIGWWMTGKCRCAANASCTRIESEVKDGFWCKCDEGFVGDGFADGEGCRSGKVKETRSTESTGKKTYSATKKILIATGGASIIIFACVILGFKLQRCKSCAENIFSRKYGPQRNIEMLLEKCGSLAPRRYKYSEVKKITNSFQHTLGKGGFGTVYKGSLQDGRLVAVKILHKFTSCGEEFLNEIISIGITSHVNVVSLLGFCIEDSKHALIYEYMPNGSLDNYIYSENSRTVLRWEKLYEIAIGIARGLEYLHRGCNARIVHFDIKPQNILLDEDFNPKIADFGLAKLCPPKESIFSMAEMRGTIGFIAPEVFSRSFGVVSTKSDVYSYGMMVLEMVGGRRNAKPSAENSSQVYFPHWLYDRLVEDGQIETCDVAIVTNKVARKLAIVGLWCTQIMPVDRPSMSRVVEMLERGLDELEMPPKPSFSSPPHLTIISTSSSILS